jgi:hypothetical protein
VGRATPHTEVEDFPSQERNPVGPAPPQELVGVLPLAVGSHRQKLLPKSVGFRSVRSCPDGAGFEEKNK